MYDELKFDPNNYTVKTCELDGRKITYRAFEGIRYCTKPVDAIQKMNLFVPEVYYHGEKINGYGLKTAPIFAPNTVGGYMPGQADEPGLNPMQHVPNTVFEGLYHGYVVACAGVRGRTSGMKTQEFFVGGKGQEEPQNTGKLVGRAPALLVDMKAAVRYLRHNQEWIPGDPEKIITNGTSAGGALSAMTGASGNSPDFEAYLEAIGAARERDDIFAASCYCPIHNLENADAAYEWLFSGKNDYHRMQMSFEDGEVRFTPVSGMMSPMQIALSKELKDLFPAYLNSLDLKDAQGNPLTLDADGSGSFRDYVARWVLKAANRELVTHDSAHRLRNLAVPGSEVEQQQYLTFSDGKAAALDWDGFTSAITRMKSTPAFDALGLDSPENEEFGTEEIFAQHFTSFAQKHSGANGTLVAPEIIKLINPVSYVGTAGTAPYWRIRHGVYDRDTSLAIPVILATLLENKGYDVDFALPWGLPHSGDYDLAELFAWIDRICKD